MGFDQRRQRGSHVVMRRGEHGCSVPLHREMKTGVLRQARVSPEEFVRHLK